MWYRHLFHYRKFQNICPRVCSNRAPAGITLLGLKYDYTLYAETGAHPVTCDVTDEHSVRFVAEQILEEQGTIDALVNIAGGAIGVDKVADGKPADYLKMYQMNVLGILHMVRVFAEALRLNGHGTILNLTSTAAEHGYEGGAGYNAAKFGARGLTEALRLEEAEHNVRVIEICPGMVHTEEFSLNRLGSKEAAERVYAGVEKPLTALRFARWRSRASSR